MKRLNFYLPQPYLDRLRRMSDETGLTVSELIRRSIEEFLNREKKK